MTGSANGSIALFKQILILKKKYNAQTADFFINAVLINPTTIFSTIHYKWQLINSDIDDNKFVDCALNGQADYLVTDDRHFDILENMGFPPVKILKTMDFLNLIFDLSK